MASQDRMAIPVADLFRGWGRVLTGYCPSISVEITRECPLHCPGCYAYTAERFHSRGSMQSMPEYRGQALIDGVLALVREHCPLHVSIVGGEPLMRMRELDVLLPRLTEAGMAVRVVTSAVREIPARWSRLDGLSFAVSVDGLEADHNARRAPATYDTVLQNIHGHSVILHCVVTGQMARRPGYFDEFLAFWSERPEVLRIWFSLYTPQTGEHTPEVLSPKERAGVLEALAALRPRFPKVELPDAVIAGYLEPPASPHECVFARWVPAFAADLVTRITPCQLGGDPDCLQCGCMPAAGLKSLGDYRLLGLLPVRSVARASTALGETTRRWRRAGTRDHAVSEL
jgi:MoaA/NifB/PqqE/SkfB family radical SAM enzyme